VIYIVKLHICEYIYHIHNNGVSRSHGSYTCVRVHNNHTNGIGRSHVARAEVVTRYVVELYICTIRCGVIYMYIRIIYMRYYPTSMWPHWYVAPLVCGPTGMWPHWYPSCCGAIRPTQSIMYVPLQVNRSQKSILLIVQYKY